MDFSLTATIYGHMRSADRISIKTDRLACIWKVEMKRKDNIKGEGVGENRGSEKSGKKHYSNVEPDL